MIETYKSKVPFPIEVSKVSSETVQILTEQNYFEDQFDYPGNAMTFFYEKFGTSLVQKFIDGNELIWEESEFEILIVKISVEQIVNELELNEVVNIFEDEHGEKIIVLK